MSIDQVLQIHYRGSESGNGSRGSTHRTTRALNEQTLPSWHSEA